MKIYKILWLDDQFAVNANSVLKNRFEDFNKRDFSKCFDITTVSNSSDFKTLFTQKIYDAIILDVYGHQNSDDFKNTQRAFDDALRVVRTKNIVKFVFSGEITEEGKDDFIYRMKIENFFFVEKTESLVELFKRIKDKLENKADLLCPEIHAIISDGIITNQNVIGAINKVKSDYNNVSSGLSQCDNKVFNNIRDCLEAIFMTECKTKGIIPASFKLQNKDVKSDSLNNCIKYITGYYPETSAPHLPDYKKPHISDDNLPSYVRCVINYLTDFANAVKHFNNSTNDTEYYSLLFDTVFNSFFIAIKWYYKFISTGAYK